MALDKILEAKILQDIEALIPVEERWENLTLANDFMFRAVMTDETLCTEMMRRILPDIEISYISIPEAQKTLKETVGTRGVRFDLYAKSGGKIYDIEIQTTKNADLPRRARAYQISMGLDVMNRERNGKKVKHYKNIPDSYVIFICTFDPFTQGRYIYTFKNICSEEKGLELGDGAFTIFLNAKGKTGKISKKLKAFLDFLNGKETPGDAYIQELARRLAMSKASIDWRRVYMYDWIFESSKLEDAREEAATKAAARVLAEAEKEKAEAVARVRAETLAEARAEAEKEKAEAVAEVQAKAAKETARATAETAAKSSAVWIESLKNLGLAENVLSNLAATVSSQLQLQSTTGA